MDPGAATTTGIVAVEGAWVRKRLLGIMIMVMLLSGCAFVAGEPVPDETRPTIDLTTGDKASVPNERWWVSGRSV